MTFATLKAWIQEQAEANDFSFIFDWTVNVGNYPAIVYPCFYLNPPIERERAGQNGVTTFEITYYLIDTKRNSSGEGQTMTADEKLAAWEALRTAADAIHRDIFDRESQITEFGGHRLNISGDVVFTRDEDMTNDDDLFISVKFNIDVMGVRC